MPEQMVKEVEGFLIQGGRLIVCFFPEATAPFRWNKADEQANPEKSSKDETQRGRKSEKRKPPRNIGELQEREIALKERWGLEFAFAPLEPGDNDAYEPVTVLNKTDLPLPKSLPWHSGLVFTNITAPWKIIYARSKLPVFVERSFGPGTLVMATDSYFLSNEALRKERHPDLLAWLLGSAREIVFDEAHLGIVEQSGVATLIRRYHLVGVAGVLLLLAGLFVWKNSASLVPAYEHRAARDLVTGEEAAAGFVKLLRRNIRAGELLEICLTEWSKSVGRTKRHAAAKLQQAQEIVKTEKARPLQQRNPLKAYQQISEILNPKIRMKNKNL